MSLCKKDPKCYRLEGHAPPCRHNVPRVPTTAELIRATLESIVHEADSDHTSEQDSTHVFIRRTTIEEARKLLKLKSTRSTRRNKQ